MDADPTAGREQKQLSQKYIDAAATSAAVEEQLLE